MAPHVDSFTPYTTDVVSCRKKIKNENVKIVDKYKKTLKA